MENGLMVCIVEDNAPIRKLFCTMLNKSGIKTADFGDGASAIAWLKNNKAIGLMLDILLPDTNGSELLAKIRNLENHKNTPAIAVTGFAQTHDRERYISQGFGHYISKPINTSTFVAEVKQFLNI
jgi:two-component system CheB/CheR fusion protein